MNYLKLLLLSLFLISCSSMSVKGVKLSDLSNPEKKFSVLKNNGETIEVPLKLMTPGIAKKVFGNPLREGLFLPKDKSGRAGYNPSFILVYPKTTANKIAFNFKNKNKSDPANCTVLEFLESDGWRFVSSKVVMFHTQKSSRGTSNCNFYRVGYEYTHYDAIDFDNKHTEVKH